MHASIVLPLSVGSNSVIYNESMFFVCPYMKHVLGFLTQNVSDLDICLHPDLQGTGKVTVIRTVQIMARSQKVSDLSEEYLRQ